MFLNQIEEKPTLMDAVEVKVPKAYIESLIRHLPQFSMKEELEHVLKHQEKSSNASSPESKNPKPSFSEACCEQTTKEIHSNPEKNKETRDLVCISKNTLNRITQTLNKKNIPPLELDDTYFHYVSCVTRKGDLSLLNPEGKTLMQAMLFFGADPTIKNLCNKTPFFNVFYKNCWAKENQDIEDIAVQFIKRIKNSILFTENKQFKKEIIFQVIQQGSVRLFTALMDGIEDQEEQYHLVTTDESTDTETLRLVNYVGCSILHAAIMLGKFELAHHIALSYDDLVKKIDYQGRTPMHYLCIEFPCQTYSMTPKDCEFKKKTFQHLNQVMPLDHWPKDSFGDTPMDCLSRNLGHLETCSNMFDEPSAPGSFKN